MDSLVDKHPELTLRDIKLAGEFLQGMCAANFPESTAFLAESLLWRHLNSSKDRKKSSLRRLILACLFLAIKLEESDFARNDLFMDMVCTPVKREDIIEEELKVLESVNWRPLLNLDMV